MVDSHEVDAEVGRSRLKRNERFLDAAGDTFEALRQGGDDRLDVLCAGERRLDPQREVGDTLFDPLERLARLNAPRQVGNCILEPRGVLGVVVRLRSGSPARGCSAR